MSCGRPFIRIELVVACPPRCCVCGEVLADPPLIVFEVESRVPGRLSLQLAHAVHVN